jgi:hypothetical protein
MLCFKPAVNDGGQQYALPLAAAFPAVSTGPSGGSYVSRTDRFKLIHSFIYTREEILRHIYELRPYILSL